MRFGLALVNTYDHMAAQEFMLRNIAQIQFRV